LTFRVRNSFTRSEEPLEKNYSSTALPGQILLGSQRDRSIYYRNIFEPSINYRFGRENNISLNYRNNIYRNENSEELKTARSTISTLRLITGSMFGTVYS